MKNAEDFRSIARDVLDGKWMTAVVVSLVAILLGAVDNLGPKFSVSVEGETLGASFNFFGHTVFSMSEHMNDAMSLFLVGSFVYIMIFGLIGAALYFVLRSVITTGYAKFHLNLYEGVEGSVDSLFAYFSEWKKLAAARFFKKLYIFLWTLAFVIPGIRATYSYAMTDFILAENPELTAKEALARSKEMMEGNRWRLFCLNFSFIGWSILCSFTMGIGYLWLTPYEQAAVTAFYREVSGTEKKEETEEFTEEQSEVHEYRMIEEQ